MELFGFWSAIITQVLVDDLKLFVEMFQTFCEDPRDLADLKVSEAKLKEELETVQNQLKGHELQVISILKTICKPLVAKSTTSNTYGGSMIATFVPFVFFNQILHILFGSKILL